MNRVKYHQDDDDDLLTRALNARKSHSENQDDDLNSLSFGALNSAQKKLHQSKRNNNVPVSSDDSNNEFDDNSNSETEESDSDGNKDMHKNHRQPSKQSGKAPLKKKKSKHAPTESSSKRPVSKIRKLEGMNPKYTQGLHQDIRFDAAFGKADLQEARKNYGFLDEYRQNEISQLQNIIKDKKTFNSLPGHEQEEIKFQLQSLKSRLDTLKNRDLQNRILNDYKRQQVENIKSGKQSTPYFLKKSEQRKLLQKAKFDSMKPGQREKVIERKRKRKLGKEFKELEFRDRT